MPIRYFPMMRPLAAALAMTLVAATASAMGTHPKVVDDEGVASRIQSVGRVEFSAAEAVVSSSRSGETIYKTACSVCHATGAAGAPIPGDKGAWGPRLVQGLDGLLKSAINGKNAMPVRGGSNASDIELARAIVHMANQSGASFKEPAETE